MTLARKHEIHAGADDRIGFGQAERLQCVEELAGGLGIIVADGLPQVRLEERELVRQPGGAQTIKTVVVERVDDVRHRVDEIDIAPVRAALVPAIGSQGVQHRRDIGKAPPRAHRSIRRYRQ